jgi:hypothetical protein
MEPFSISKYHHGGYDVRRNEARTPIHHMLII